MFESLENPKLAVVRDLYLNSILLTIDERKRTEYINRYDDCMNELTQQERNDFFKLKGIKNLLRIINKYRLIS